MTDLSAEGRERLREAANSLCSHSVYCRSIPLPDDDDEAWCDCGFLDFQQAVPALLDALDAAEKERDALRDVAAFERLQHAKEAESLRLLKILHDNAVSMCHQCEDSNAALRTALEMAVRACGCGGLGFHRFWSPVRGEMANPCPTCAPWRKALEGSR